MGSDQVDLAVRVALGSHAPTGVSTKIIAVDGPGGAGKSTLAALVAAVIHAPVVHTDDFASWDTPLEWWPRLLDEVLLPLSRNDTARYQRYDWDAGALAEWHEVEPGGLIVIEGVSSSRVAFRPYLACSIWVDTPRDERLRRGLERDGVDSADLWTTWMAAEDEWITEEDPRSHATLVLSGIS